MKYGLIGYPIGHSLSPAMFRACYPQHSYELIETPRFEDALVLVRRDFDAVNVTAPFKEDAFLAADEADEATMRLRAANILINRDGRLSAMNSDHLAVRRMLSGLPQLKEGSRILVLGCGGAGRAAAYASAGLGFRMAVTNRTLARAQQFCSQDPLMEAMTLEEGISRIDSFSAIIYTIPTGIEQTPIISESGAVILEAGYREPHFGGSNYVSGTKWLAYQAIPGFKAMTGIEPDETKIMDAIHK